MCMCVNYNKILCIRNNWLYYIELFFAGEHPLTTSSPILQHQSADLRHHLGHVHHQLGHIHQGLNDLEGQKGDQGLYDPLKSSHGLFDPLKGVHGHYAPVIKEEGYGHQGQQQQVYTPQHYSTSVVH